LYFALLFSLSDFGTAKIDVFFETANC